MTKETNLERAAKFLEDWNNAENIKDPAEWLEDAVQIISGFVGGEEE